nr:hypothetical protein [Tanacetum cinerariifolium]
MSSLFVDTHNVVVILEKSDAAKGFEQIIDFLSGSYIYHALTVNPHIYISCIKQFWNSASVKRSDDVTRLQALVDRKKIMISEVVIREILQLDDAEGVVCLPDEEIFAGLAKMGYEKPSTKLTFYKAFFSKQSSPPQQPQSLPQAPPQGAEFPTHLFQQVLDTCSALTCRVKNLEHNKAAQKLEIIKLKARVKRLKRANKVKSSKLRRLKKVGASKRIESSDDIEDVFNQGRMINDLDKDEGIELVVDQVKDVDIVKTEGRHAAKQAEKQAQIYHLDLDHHSKVLNVVTTATSQVSAGSANIFAAKPSIPAAAPTVDKGKGIMIETPKPMKKKDQIELDAEYARKLHEEINKDIDWDAAIDHVKQKSKNPQYIKRYQQMEEEDQEVLKIINETLAHEAAKRRKLNEEAQEAEDLKKHLESPSSSSFAYSSSIDYGPWLVNNGVIFFEEKIRCIPAQLCKVEFHLVTFNTKLQVFYTVSDDDVPNLQINALKMKQAVQLVEQTFAWMSLKELLLCQKSSTLRTSELEAFMRNSSLLSRSIDSSSAL